MFAIAQLNSLKVCFFAWNYVFIDKCDLWFKSVAADHSAYLFFLNKLFDHHYTENVSKIYVFCVMAIEII